MTALGKLGDASSEVVSNLLSLLNDTELGLLGKISDTILQKVVQWLEQNPNDDGIGSAIDCLWSIVVE